MTRHDLPTDDHPAEATVRQALHGAAAGLHVTTPGADAVAATAHHRARRHQRVTAGLAVLALTAGGVGIQRLLDRQPGVQLATGDQSPPALTFTWTQGEQVLSPRPQIVQAPDGVLYALSTAPGVRFEDVEHGPLPQAVYRSEDGLTWQPTALDPDLQLNSFAVADDGLLYAISTAPGDAGTTQVRVATSEDGGGSWQMDVLPLVDDRPAVADGIQLASGGGAIDVVVYAGTAVATIQRSWIVLPDGLVPPDQASSSWVTPTDDGLVVETFDEAAEPDPEGPATAEDRRAAETPTPHADAGGADAAPGLMPRPTETTVAQTVPWEETGLEGPQDLVSSQAVVSTPDGGGWDPIDLGPAGMLAEVVATSEGFTALLHQPQRQELQEGVLLVARSTDGRSWTTDPEPIASLAWVEEVGVVGDRIVAIGQAVEGTTAEPRFTTVALSSGDAGRTWVTTDLAELFAAGPGQDVALFGADLGALGAALPLTQYDRSDGDVTDAGVLHSPDGVAWDLIPLDRLHPDARQVSWLSIDADRIIASVGLEDGSTRTVVGVPQH